MKPGLDVNDALSNVEALIKKYKPDEPFDYKFLDDEYAKKLSGENRIGNLATVFAHFWLFSFPAWVCSAWMRYPLAPLFAFLQM